MASGSLEHIGISHGLYEWVYEANYASTHEEYYRLWRGKWAEQDKMRQSERSRIIAPALQQAVESSVAEIETASFSQSFMFDIVDDEENPPLQCKANSRQPYPRCLRRRVVAPLNQRPPP